MKKVSLLFLALGVAVSVNAQKAVTQRTTEMMVKPSKNTSVEVSTINAGNVNHKVNKPVKATKDLTIVQIGNSGNKYGYFAGSTASNSSRAFISIVPELNIINFVHRSKTGSNGATSSGFCHIDYSTDAGATWTINDSLWEADANSGWPGWNMRYPQAVLYNPAGNTNPNDVYVLGLFPFNHATLGTIDTQGYASKTLNNQYISQQIFGLIDAGGTNWGGSDNLTKKSNGEIYNIDNAWEMTLGGDDIDSLNVVKFTYNTTNHNWNVTQKVIPIQLTFESQVPPGNISGFDHWAASIKVDFSGDGQTGYCFFNSHNDSSFQIFYDGQISPIYIKTTDGGATWSTTKNLGKHFRHFNALKYLLSDAAIVDSLGWVSTYDSVEWYRNNKLDYRTLQMENSLAVDANGNPHVFVRTEARDDQYVYLASWATGLIEYYSEDGGATWDARVIGRANYGFGTYGAIHERNRLYITKSPDRTKLFFTWLDSDKGSGDNSSPNIFVRGIDVNTGKMTDTINVTRNTNAEGIAHFGSPSYDFCLTTPTGYLMPFVYSSFDFTQPDPAGTAADFFAITDFTIEASQFVDPIQTTFNTSVANQVTLGTITMPFGGNKVWATYNTGSKGDTTILVQAGTVISGLSSGTHVIKLHNDLGAWTKYNVTVTGINDVKNAVANFTAYPNPAKDQLNVSFNIEGSQNVTVKLVSINGQVAFAETFNANGNVSKTIDVSNFAQGIYFVQVVTANGVATQKVAIR